MNIKWIYRSSRPDVFCKNIFLIISQNSHEKTCIVVSFSTKSQASDIDIFLLIYKILKAGNPLPG